MDDAELPAAQQPVMEPLHKRDTEGSVLFSRIMDMIYDIGKQRRGLTPKAIYIGLQEFDTLRAWSEIGRWYTPTAHGDMLAGLPLHKVSDRSHAYVAWE